MRIITNTLSRNSSLYDTKCYRCGSSACLYRDTCCKRWRTNWKHSPNADNCRKAVNREFIFPVDISQSPTVGQQRHQISELQFDEFTTPSTFSCWHVRFKNQVTTCSDFPSALLWITEVEMVDSVDEFKTSRSTAGKNFLLWVRSSRIHTSRRRRSVSRNRKPRKRTSFYEEDRSPSWSTTTFELLALTSTFLTTLIYSLSLFVTTMILEFDTRWDELLLSMTKIPSDDILFKLRIRVSNQLFSVFDLYDMEIHQKISMFFFRCWWLWRREAKIRNFDCEFFDAGQCSFLQESDDRAKPTPKTVPPSEPPTSKTRGRSASRKETWCLH